MREKEQLLVLCGACETPVFGKGGATCSTEQQLLLPMTLLSRSCNFYHYNYECLSSAAVSLLTAAYFGLGLRRYYRREFGEFIQEQPPPLSHLLCHSAPTPPD